MTWCACRNIGRGNGPTGKCNRLVGRSSNLPPKLVGGRGRSSRFLQPAVRRNCVEKPWSQRLFPREALGQPCMASGPLSLQEKEQASLAISGAVNPGFRARMGQCFSNKDWEQMAPRSPQPSLGKV